MADAHLPQTVRIALKPLQMGRMRVLSAITSHGPAAVVLLKTGVGLLRQTPPPHGAELLLAVTATAAGAAQAVVLVREILERRHLDAQAKQFKATSAAPDGGQGAIADSHTSHSHADESRYHIPSFVVALVYAAETWLHWHETGHVTRPYILGAIVFTIFGLGGLSFLTLRSRRVSLLTIDASGVALTRPRRDTVSLPWADIDSIELRGTSAHLHATRGASLEFDAADYDHGRDVLGRLQDAITAFGRSSLVARIGPTLGAAIPTPLATSPS